MESGIEFWDAKALLDWQVEMGADEAIGDTPVNRYELETAKPVVKPAAVAPLAPVPDAEVDQVQAARAAAMAAQDLAGLQAAMAAYEGCALKAAARNLVFSDGVAGAPVMIITDAPDRDDDRAGQLFSGRTGALFDKMIAAIGLARTGDAPVYMAPVIPWNPPQNSDPKPEDVAMMLPFLERHIALAAPKVLVLMGNGPCHALIKKSGMTRLRGGWTEAASLPALPMFAPTYLLQNGAAKRDTWADLLSLKSRLKDLA